MRVSKVLVCHLEASYPGPHEVAADDGAGGAQQVHHARPGEVKVVLGLYTGTFSKDFFSQGAVI